MNNTASKFFRALCGMVVVLVLVASITSVPALAASNSIYIATATPHYKHPTTGVIEDAGGDGSATLGQSMTESATYKKALVEVDPNGNTYITIRLQLMDNIQNPSFQVDGKSVTADIMQENWGSSSTDTTADFRMKVNSENSVIRVSMYVVPMGRNVVFYITVSNLQEGSGDFITSVKVVEPEPDDTTPPATSTTEPDTSTTEPPATSTTEPSTSTTVPDTSTTVPDTSTTVPDTSEPTTETTTPSEETTTPSEETTTPSTSATEETTGKEDETEGAGGLVEYDENGNIVNNAADENSGEADNSNLGMFGIVIGVVAVVSVAGFCVWYFGFFKKKKN